MNYELKLKFVSVFVIPISFVGGAILEGAFKIFASLFDGIPAIVIFIAFVDPYESVSFFHSVHLFMPFNYVLTNNKKEIMDILYYAKFLDWILLVDVHYPRHFSSI